MEYSFVHRPYLRVSLELVCLVMKKSMNDPIIGNTQSPGVRIQLKEGGITMISSCLVDGELVSNKHLIE